MSVRCQPRRDGTRCIKAHQNTKNVKLFRAMKSACSTNAPRSAIVALTFVPTSAPVKARLDDLPAIDGDLRHRSPKHQGQANSCDAGPDQKVEAERQRRHG